MTVSPDSVAIKLNVIVDSFTADTIARIPLRKDMR